MVSTRSTTIPPASDVPAGQSITLQPPQTAFAAPPAAPPAASPEREEQLLNQQLNVEQPNLAALLLQQSQLLQQMERRQANLEGCLPMQASSAALVPPAPPVLAIVPPVISSIPSSPTSQPNSYILHAPTPKDPRDRIKRTEVPKYDGTKDADNWLLDFTKYCRLTRLAEDEHILTAFSIAMTDKAGRWWEYAEKSFPPPQTWQTTKEAFLRKYANVLKRDECVDKLRDLCQGSTSVADFFTEIEELNLYAQLDPESLPLPLKRGLNSDLRNAMDISHSIKPITTYQEWKEKALYLGA